MNTQHLKSFISAAAGALALFFPTMIGCRPTAAPTRRKQ